jgi:hypothetical protein
MHRKPQLQDAARKLQELVNSRTGDISYTQALEILGQLEGFEGYAQLRQFVALHSQHSRDTEVTPVAQAQPKEKSKFTPVVVEPETGFLEATENESLARAPASELWPSHCQPDDASPELTLPDSMSKGVNPLVLLPQNDRLPRQMLAIDVVLTRDLHDGSATWQNRVVEIELPPSETPVKH